MHELLSIKGIKMTNTVIYIYINICIFVMNLLICWNSRIKKIIMEGININYYYYLLALIEDLFWARNYARQLTHNLLNPHNNPNRQMVLLPTFYNYKN